jgi:hypothetical protein
MPPGAVGYDFDTVVAKVAQKFNGTYRMGGATRGNGDGWREYEVEERNSKKLFSSGRIIVVRGRLYMLFASGKDARLSNPQVRKFLDSFRLSDGETPGAGEQITQPAAPAGKGPAAIPLAPVPARPAPSAPPSAGPPPVASPPPPKDTIVSLTADPQFRDEAPEGGLLVGLDVWYGTYSDYDVICGIRALYRVGTVESAGPIYGQESKRGARVLAKPGYAVGAVVARYGACIDSLTVTFMHITDGRLDPNDAYTAEKVGGPGGYGPEKLGGDGSQIIGIAGRKGTSLTGFGLAYPER